MFITKHRIDEDLEIAKRAMFEMPRDTANITDHDEAPGAADFFGLWGAAISVIAPWAVAFAAAIVGLGWLMSMWMST